MAEKKDKANKKPLPEENREDDMLSVNIEDELPEMTYEFLGNLKDVTKKNQGRKSKLGPPSKPRRKSRKKQEVQYTYEDALAEDIAKKNPHMTIEVIRSMLRYLT